MKCLILTSLIIAFGLNSWADQCAWISQEQAQKAMAALEQAKEVKSFCEPCRQHALQTIDIQKLEILPINETSNLWKVLVNNKGIDAAYIYVDQLNLAEVIQCPTEGVSDSIRPSAN